MDLAPSEDSSLEDKNKILGENIDDIAACIGSIKLADKMCDVENDSTQLKVSSKGDEQNHGGEKDEIDENHKELTNSTEGDEANGNELTEIENNLKEFLEKLECPFSWNFKNYDSNRRDTLSRTIDKIKEIEADISLHWRSFVMRLVLCYEYYNNNDIESAFDEIQKCETLINAPDIKEYYKEFFQSIRSALLHIISASKAYLYLKKGDLDEVEKILNSICREEEMDSTNKAAIWGIKAAVSLEYGYEGTKNAIDYINKALELDKEGEWYFILGKSLGRIRRIDNYNEIPTLQELKALEEAVKISRIPTYIIFLAQTYCEAAFRAFSLNRYDLEPVLKKKLEKMNKRSAELYKEALKVQGDCSHVNMRCARGFYKLPYPFKDIQLAKQCSEKALQLAPENAMVYHVRGNILEHDGDYNNARTNYVKSGELGAFGALMDLHRMEFKLNNAYDPLPSYENMLKQFAERPRWEETLCQMGSYYYFMKHDLPTAYKQYWRKVIEENPHSEKLKCHKNVLLIMKKPLDIYQILYDEARLALQSIDTKSGEEIKMYREILHLCSDLFPDLEQNSPKPWRKIVMEESLSNNRSSHTSGRGRGRGRGAQAPRRGSGGNQSRENWRDHSNTSEASGSQDSNTGASGSRDSNTRYIRGNSNSNADSRPGQRFVRRTSDSNWRSH